MADVFDGDFNGLEYLVVPEGWFESEHFVIRAIALILVSEEMLLSQLISCCLYSTRSHPHPFPSESVFSLDPRD